MLLYEGNSRSQGSVMDLTLILASLSSVEKDNVCNF